MNTRYFVFLIVGILSLSACTGPEGPIGPAGPVGSAGISGYEVVVAQSALDNTASKQLRADCPAGKQALGAGWSVLDSTDAILEGQATYFEPAFDGSHWLTNARNMSGFAPEWKLRVRLVCANIDG
jgi:hypothetical protein